MQIVKQQKGDSTELKISGRLDAYWSDHLGKELQAAIREGSHHLILDLAEVQYISSAGIRVLLTYYRQLTQIDGSLRLINVSGPAKSILEMAGLAEVLLRESAPVAATPEVQSRKLESSHGAFELFSIHPKGTLKCKLIGDPALLDQNRADAIHPEKIRITKSSFAFGLGAFGEDWEESKQRCGEFLAVAGAAAYLPTDGTNIPDYLVSSGSYFPELMVAYGAICTGDFSHLLRFEAKPEAGAIPLMEVIEKVSEALESARLGFVLIGEAAGLVGASLLRSPVQASNAGIFDYPETQNWLSFTAERAHSRSLALVVGMTDEARSNRTILRSLAQNHNLSGHFHAAAFPYRPIKKGELDLESTVSTLFEFGTVEGILHLVHDDRPIGGAGDSEFIRGACWVGAVSEVLSL